jgi:uncharacterized membrane protein YoaK (UPF0700 family)
MRGEGGPAVPQRRTSQSFALGVLLAAAAGAIEAYSVLRLNAFAGAQTGNVVLGAVAVSRGEWKTTVRYIWPILAFVCGVLMARTLVTGRVAVLVRRPFRAVLIAELVTLIIVGVLPTATPHAIVSVIITVAVAVQAATFRTLVDVGYNSAFTTGNLMNAVASLHAAVSARDRAELLHARRIFAVIGCYAAGAIAGGLCARAFGRPTVWCAAVLLAAALVLFVADERRRLQTVTE